MQDLLKTRFNLTVKREIRESQVYFMTLVKGGYNSALTGLNLSL